ncbi:MAG: PQQ-dependent sugar dehydrogenase, partial [Bacteroidia bacterium]|nr:PQQ-dependent sugar dehydrogenase [Bacteroidia bacterium]
MKTILKLLLVATALFSCNSDDADPIDNSILDLAEAFPGLVFNSPVDLQSPADGSDRLFVVEKTGRIKLIENPDSSEATVFLDLSNGVNTGSEQGLLGLAFHPDFNNNGFFYINYNPDASTTRVSRFSISANDPNIADMNSEVVLLSFFQDAQNH